MGKTDETILPRSGKFIKGKRSTMLQSETVISLDLSLTSSFPTTKGLCHVNESVEVVVRDVHRTLVVVSTGRRRGRGRDSTIKSSQWFLCQETPRISRLETVQGLSEHLRVVQGNRVVVSLKRWWTAL